MSIAISTSIGLKLLEAGELNATLELTSRSTWTSLAWSSDGGALFGLSEGSVKQLVDGVMTDVVKTAPSKQSPDITALAVRDKGKELLFAQASKIYFYDLRSKRLSSGVLEGHKSQAQISKLAINPSDTHIASLTSSAILIHSLSAPHIRASIKAPTDSHFTCLAFSPSRKTTLITGHVNGMVNVWDTTKTSAPLRQLQAVKGEVVDLSYSPYNKRLCAVASKDGDVALVDLEEETNAPFHKTIPGSAPLTSVAFLPGGVSLLAGTSDGRLQQYNLRSLNKPPTVIVGDDQSGRIYAIAVASSKTRKEDIVETAAAAPDPKQKVLPAKSVPLAERPPNVPTSPTARRLSHRSTSVASPPTKPARRASQAPVSSSTSTAASKGKALPPGANLALARFTHSSLSPGRASRHVISTSRSASSATHVTSTSSRATPGSPHLPSVSGSPPMPTKRTARMVLATDNSATASGQARKRGTDKEQRAKDTLFDVGEGMDKGKKVILRTPTPSRPASAPRPVSPPVGSSRLQAPVSSTSTALILSPARRRILSPAGPVALEQAVAGVQGSDMLKVALASALSDWRAEASRATRNLHMEVIRSARLQKNDFRRMMEEYMDEVTRLREENEMLRKENERLRRGF